MSFVRFSALMAAALATSSCARSQPAPKPGPSATLPSRVLVVSGGPSPDYNQYAIESNARYVEKLTARARSRRILFADGKLKSSTISTIQVRPGDDARRVLAWLIDTEAPAEHIAYRASGLKRIDGAAISSNIAQSVQEFAREVRPGERALLYFTGHGSPGRKKRLTLMGIRNQEDFENTLYSTWNDGEFSVGDLAGALKTWPARTPLILVMVQCHAGGFANLLFEAGNSRGAVAKRDFCGFFAATAERQASGCTSEVDEVNYQDFTTHFFAALSGVSRDGRRITGADFDKNGGVSMLEALAWTNGRDNSIDVPLCTSDAYLRSIWSAEVDPAWVKTPFSSLVQGAAPWQQATLNSLSKTLVLRGESRVESAIQKQRLAVQSMELGDEQLPSFSNPDAVQRRFEALELELSQRFPGLKAPANSAHRKRAQSSALLFLSARKGDVALLSKAMSEWEAQSERSATREAQCLRFIRAARTLWLEKKLRSEGTAMQKATFARIRASESRNPLR